MSRGLSPLLSQMRQLRRTFYTIPMDPITLSMLICKVSQRFIYSKHIAFFILVIRREAKGTAKNTHKPNQKKQTLEYKDERAETIFLT